MKLMQAYFTGLSNYLSEGWNRFWFTPTDSRDLCRLRLPLGALLLVWQLSFTPDLLRWFGANGWMDIALFRRLVGAPTPATALDHLSYLFSSSPTVLWICHILSAIVLLLFTIGFKTRWMNGLSFGVILAYIHRAPFLNGATEMLLTMLTGYLVLAPSGDYYSWDARGRAEAPTPTSGATIARRLIQLHVILFYLAVLSTQLASVTWWRGDAIWWIAARPDSRLVNLDWVRLNPNVMNLWTHAIVLSELLFLALIWNRWFRPLVVALSSLAWLSLGLASGNFGLTITLCVAHLVFLLNSESPRSAKTGR